MGGETVPVSLPVICIVSLAVVSELKVPEPANSALIVQLEVTAVALTGESVWLIVSVREIVPKVGFTVPVVLVTVFAVQLAVAVVATLGINVCLMVVCVVNM